MPAPSSQAYTYGHKVEGDGTVSFLCSTDTDAWPWLELPPQHPIPLQTQNYWSSVGASAALGTLEEGKWSALTWTDWELGDRTAGMAARGTFSRTLVDDKLAFETRLFDTAGRLIVTMRGRGVVFRNRNFEAWRAEAKREVSHDAPAGFAYAPRELLGLSERELPLVSCLTGKCATALVTKANGLMPGHPYFSGSGDHVNAPHLAEIARQVVSLMCDGAPFLVTGGEMDMRRYIELDCAFDIAITGQDDASATMQVSQMDKPCAQLTLRWELLSA
ncbi:hypothetical protein [Altererythrobacter sp. Z27]|uniref:hypothetical protein n=1 Tax=Altererythrobacter sp. Z27 TaxID=3461147 RepID=UPI0040443FBC